LEDLKVKYSQCQMEFENSSRPIYITEFCESMEKGKM